MRLRCLRWTLAACACAASLAAGPTDALALKRHARDGWMVGIGIGYGGSKIETGSALQNLDTGWQEGACPQIRLGKMLSPHFMVSFDQKGWLDEQGAGTSKVRVGIQTFAAALTVFPGNPDNETGGIYARGGVGFANARLTVFENTFVGSGPDSLDHGEHKDEGGVGFTVGGGYEFRFSSALAAGLDVSANYQHIDQAIFDKTWFFPAVLSLNWYF